MDVNSVSQSTASYASYEPTLKKDAAAKEGAAASDGKAAETPAAVYEKSDQSAVQARKTYKPNQALVDQLKADQEARQAGFMSMVEKMLGQQGKTSLLADGIWKALASGDFTVDAATKAQAQKDISEDGYWGVKQTSERILDFAKALTGGDPSKMEDMRKAFEKGYAQAEKTWGGKLPDISKQTYDAVMKGFDDMQNGVTEQA